MASYTEAMGLAPDFRVSYRLFSAEEGGRKNPPFQHIRWHFSYEEEAIAAWNQLFMIWPEFISPSGQMLPEGEPMPPHGLADMFIIAPNQRDFHRQHLKQGVRGYFREGPHKVGVCEVIEILGLYQIPPL